MLDGIEAGRFRSDQGSIDNDRPLNYRQLRPHFLRLWGTARDLISGAPELCAELSFNWFNEDYEGMGSSGFFSGTEYWSVSFGTKENHLHIPTLIRNVWISRLGEEMLFLENNGPRRKPKVKFISHPEKTAQTNTEGAIRQGEQLLKLFGEAIRIRWGSLYTPIPKEVEDIINFRDFLDLLSDGF